MKKNRVILSLSILFIVLFVSGCSQKESKVSCTQTTSGIDIEFNVNLKGNIIQTMNFNYNMDLSKYSDTQIEAIEKQDFCETVKSYMTSYKEAFSTCNQKIESKKLKVNAELDANKLTKSVLSKLSTPESTKKRIRKCRL